MGYDVHITRAESWFENENAPISLEEWERLVEDNPTLQPDPGNGMPMAVWTAHPSGDEVWPWLAWNDGNITTKYPDDALLEKMLAIAASLGANVQGDDGEVHPLADVSEVGQRIGHTLLLAVATGVIAATAIPLGLYLDSHVQAQYGSRSEAPLGLALGSVHLGMFGVICIPFGSIATFVAAWGKQKPPVLWVLAALCHGFAFAYLYWAA